MVCYCFVCVVLSIKEGDDLYLTCYVRGSPPPTRLIWFKDVSSFCIYISVAMNIKI
jgi:hypothetical protein